MSREFEQALKRLTATMTTEQIKDATWRVTVRNAQGDLTHTSTYDMLLGAELAYVHYRIPGSTKMLEVSKFETVCSEPMVKRNGKSEKEKELHERRARKADGHRDARPRRARKARPSRPA